MVGFFNQLLFVLNPFSGDDWSNFFLAIGRLIGRVLYYTIVCGISRVADICQLIFKKFAGISDSGLTFNGEKLNGEKKSGDIVLSLIQSDIAKNIFFALVILAVLILLIATFAATIKTEFAKDGNNNKRKVIKNAFRGLANFVLVPVICLFGIFVGNALLKAIDGATSPGDGSSLSSRIFIVGAYNANRARASENKEYDGTNNPYLSGTFGENLVGEDGDGYGNFGIFIDDSLTSVNPRRAADKIDACFSANYKLTIDSNMTWAQSTLDFAKKNNLLHDADTAFSVGLYLNYVDKGGNSTDVNLIGNKLFHNGVIVFLEGETIQFSIYNVGLVFYYYELSLGCFDYLISAVALIFCAWTLLVTVLGLIKRMFMITTLFLVSAPVCAIYPLDDGKALGNWRGAFIKEVLSVYSVVVVMNIFLSLLPLITSIEVFTGSGDLLFLSAIPGINGLANYLAQVLIVIGGLTFFKGATKTLADIIGAGNAYADGSDATKNFATNVGRVASGVALGAGVARGAARLAGRGIISEFDKELHRDNLGADRRKSLHEKLDTVRKKGLGKLARNYTNAQAKKDALNEIKSDAASLNNNPGNIIDESNSMNKPVSETKNPEIQATSTKPDGSVASEQKETPTSNLVQSKAADTNKPDVDNSMNAAPAETAEKKELEKPVKPERPDNGHTKFYNFMSNSSRKVKAKLKKLSESEFGKATSKSISGLLGSMKGIITGKTSVKDSYHFEKGSEKNKWTKEDKEAKAAIEKSKTQKRLAELEKELEKQKEANETFEKQMHEYKDEMKKYKQQEKEKRKKNN